jgi:hypothetical protein
MARITSRDGGGLVLTALLAVAATLSCQRSIASPAPGVSEVGVTARADAGSQKPPKSIKARIRMIVDEISEGATPKQIADALKLRIAATESPQSWDLGPLEMGATIVLDAAAKDSEATGALVLSGPPNILHLSDLQNLWGPYRHGRDGETASATFVRESRGRHVVTTAYLQSSRVASDASVNKMVVIATANDKDVRGTVQPGAAGD